MLLVCNTMQEFIKWCLDNLNFIIIVGSGVIEFILLLIFKRNKIIDDGITSRLVDWICKAESIYKLGVDKKAYVLEEAHKFLGDDFDYKFISDSIEFLLSLPKKKR